MWTWKWEWPASIVDSLGDLQTLLWDISLIFGREDKWIWGLDYNKFLSIKFCYTWLVDCVAGETHSRDTYKLLACSKTWKCDVPTKAIVLTWRLLINKLPTRDSLVRIGVVNLACESCCFSSFKQEETAQHLLFCCSKMLEVWNRVFNWLDVPVLNSQDPVNHFLHFGQKL